ncbi:MAG TPA: MarR family transcriptional regulator [Ktedonobacteraceae bacterium]|nr:MarR family transcriptional regulator [Ktedonobacteraceae bacterium]
MRPDDFAGHWIFKVVHRMGNLFSDLLQACCIAHGLSYVITPAQWAALAWLDEADGIPIGTLAQHLDIEASVTTGIVQRLEQHGLLERVHDQQDRRLVKIFLTARGREITHVLEPVAVAFHERLFQGFSSEERQAFLISLRHLDSDLPASSRDLLSLLPSSELKGDQS